MDRLAREGVVFERAYTPSPVTLPAHTSLMTGLLPPAHGVRGNGSFALGPGPATLAEQLKGAGLRTAAFIGGFPLVRRFGLSRGFEVYDDNLSKAPGVNYDFAERRASEVVEAARSWLEVHPGPAFVWVHLFDPHAPYDPPPAFRGEDPYRDEIAAADSALGSLLKAWEARPGPRLVVVTSDHGEAFGEHGEWSHSLFVYDTTLHVPLIVKGPGYGGGKRVAARVGIVDVGASLCEAAGLAPDRFPGRSLSSALGAPDSDRPLYAETLSPRLDFGWSDLRSWREGGSKWIRAPRPELYSLANDPTETRDLASIEVKTARELDGALTRVLEETGDRNAVRGPDRESTERLRSLGYVQGPGGRGSGADPKDMKEMARRIASANGPFASWPEMLKAYEPLLALDPPNPLLNMRVADALLRSGNPQAAIPHFARVVRGGPASADPFVGYATALAQLNRMREARKILEDGLKVDPASGQIHYNLGEIARLEGRREDARKAYTAALQDPVTAARAESRLADLR